VPRAMITSVLLVVSLEAANADLRIVSSGGGELARICDCLRRFGNLASGQSSTGPACRPAHWC